MQNQEVYIILVNYNGWRDTIECIQSLIATTYPRLNIIVVDNDSTDNSISHIIDFLESNAYHFQNSFNLKENVVGEKYNIQDIYTEHSILEREFTLIKSNENLGFSGGNNIGMRYAIDCQADYILLLNNDTTVFHDFIEPLVDTLEQYDDVGLVGGKIYDYNSRDNFIAGGYIDLLRGSGYHYYNKNSEQIKEVSFLSGCLWMLKRDVLEEVGFLDENFFLYIEDVEYCYRMNKYHKKLIYNPNSKIFHKESQSTGKMSPLTIYYNTRNRLYFTTKYYDSKVDIFKFYLFFIITRLIKVIFIKQNRPYIIKGVKDFLKNKMGKTEDI